MGQSSWRARTTNFSSTSFTPSTSISEILTGTTLSFCSFESTSMPRRPRCRRKASGESAIYCSSLSTKWGINSVPDRKPVLAISAILPSMITLVSTRMLRPAPSLSKTSSGFSASSPFAEAPNCQRELNPPNISFWRMTKITMPR